MPKKKNKRVKSIEKTEVRNLPVDPLHGRIFSEWGFPEFTPHERGRRWYIIAGSICVALLVYSIYTANYLFAVSIVILGIIVTLQHRRDILMIQLRIMEDGISFDEKFYEYKEFEKFWIVYEPPAVKNLYFKHKAFWKPEISISLQDMNPIPIRETLLKYIPEDLEKKQESSAETIARILKF